MRIGLLLTYILVLKFELATRKSFEAASLSETTDEAELTEFGESTSSLVPDVCPEEPIIVTLPILLASLKSGHLEAFKKAMKSTQEFVKGISQREFYELEKTIAMYGDGDCAKMLLRLPDFDELRAVKAALDSLNSKTLLIFKDSEEILMNELQNKLGSPECYGRISDWQRVEMITQLLKMYPNLANLVNRIDILTICIFHGMLDELMYLHRTCPNLSVNGGSAEAFLLASGYSAGPTVFNDNYLGVVEYAARYVFKSPALFEQALSQAAEFGALTETFMILLKTGVERGILNPLQITKFAALALDYALINEIFSMKKYAMGLLMNPALSLSERLQILERDQGHSPAISLLTLQLIAAREAPVMPNEVFDIIRYHL